MNFNKMKIVCLGVIFLFVLSCSKDKVEDISDGSETGAFSFTLKSDFLFHEVALTRSETTPILNDFKVRIENTRAEVLREWAYKDVPSLIKVVPGSYKLVAWYGNDTLLPTFDSPCYYGETKITLKNGQELDTTLVAKVSTVKVAVAFDESFGYDYDDYFVDIKTVGDSLSFAKDEIRSGYFKPGKLRMRFVLKPKGKEGYVYFYPEAIAVAKAKEFYNMTLKANTKNGALDKITITTDSTTIEIPVDVELPPFYLPKPAPKITPQGFSFGDVVETTEGMSKPATVLISSAAGLTELVLKTTSDTLIARGWPQEIDLMKATDVQKTLLKASGLEWSEDINTKDTIKTTVWVRFNNVIQLLNTAPCVTSGSAFEIVATDRFEQTPATACKFDVKVAPPVFEFINAPSEGNVFAKRVVYDVKYASEVRKPIVECQKEGGEWTALETVFAEQETENVFECIGKGLEPVNTYAFRVRMREHVLDAGSYKTEDVLQVPNAGMEAWYSEDGKTWNSFGKKGPYWFYWYPWNKDNPSTTGWNTINLKTTNADWKYQYNSISGTMQTTDKHGGSYAALIRTVGWGGGNAAVGSANASNIDPGYLYLGSYNTTTSSPDYGYSFLSRPSSLSFYYKYTTKVGQGDQFLAEMVVQYRDGSNIISLGHASLSGGVNISSYQHATLNLNYDKSYMHLKATHIYIVFKSGDNTSNDALLEVPSFANLSDGKYVGSQLYIDDIELIYE